MKYLIFKSKPEGSPKISENNFVAATKCDEGYFVDIVFKQICIDFGWVDFNEVENVTFLKTEEITP
jgi:hypothetical protein